MFQTIKEDSNQNRLFLFQKSTISDGFIFSFSMQTTEVVNV